MKTEGLYINVEDIIFKSNMLSALELHVPKGCVMGLLGANGAGKTTLINLVCGIIATGKEDVFFNGKSDFKEDLAWIFDRNLFPHQFRVKDVGKLMGYSYQGWNQGLFESYCQDYGLETKMKLRKLSLGMSQRLMQAASLSKKAKLYVFDEPSDGIDPFIRTDLLNDLRNRIYEDEATVLISSHNVDELEEIVDYVSYMEEGHLLFTYDIETLRDKAVDLLKSFGVSDKGIREYQSDTSLKMFVRMMQTERNL